MIRFITNKKELEPMQEERIGKDKKVRKNIIIFALR